MLAGLEISILALLFPRIYAIFLGGDKIEKSFGSCIELVQFTLRWRILLIDIFILCLLPEYGE